VGLPQPGVESDESVGLEALRPADDRFDSRPDVLREGRERVEERMDSRCKRPLCSGHRHWLSSLGDHRSIEIDALGNDHRLVANFELLYGDDVNNEAVSQDIEITGESPQIKRCVIKDHNNTKAALRQIGRQV